KAGGTESSSASVSWNAWYLPTFVLDMDSTVVSILPLPGTELAGTDSVKSLHFAYLALASADGASRKLAVARAADTANLVRSDIGAIPDLRFPARPSGVPAALRQHRIRGND